ncbi:hypothetical protein [Pontibacter sp. G13]|uniref:hypothetical protein n=1 Tax=Pontibacter sp. G13 TaxID=3074898 RepID=UPI002889C36A|nr:hypothetical protein [Pontibacter sp. G13]WNJ16900.1 hypothetical protein RJD25_18710 [Pontibacter sp. G13]
MLGTLIFWGFTVDRMVSRRADGKPNKQLVIGLGTELVLGGLNALGLVSMLG